MWYVVNENLKNYFIVQKLSNLQKFLPPQYKTLKSLKYHQNYSQ